MKLLEWIKLVFKSNSNSEMSVHEKEILSELQNENKIFLFDTK